MRACANKCILRTGATPTSPTHCMCVCMQWIVKSCGPAAAALDVEVHPLAVQPTLVKGTAIYSIVVCALVAILAASLLAWAMRRHLKARRRQVMVSWGGGGRWAHGP